MHPWKVMGEDRTKKHGHICPVKFHSENSDVDYMTKGGGRGLEITNIDWSNGKVVAAHTCARAVSRSPQA